MNYAKGIKELRATAHISQMELAKKIKVAYSTINRIENGHQQPYYRTQRELEKLFKKYNIKAD